MLNKSSLSLINDDYAQELVYSSNSEFMRDILSWLLRQNGGHVHIWKYGSTIRPDGSTGSTAWHDFVSKHKSYYPIMAEAALMPRLAKKLQKDYDSMIEFGVGDEKSLSTKTMPIIHALPKLERYYGFDFSKDSLDVAQKFLSEHAPDVVIYDVLADFYKTPLKPEGKRVLGSFLGTTISNLNMMVGGKFPKNELIGNLKKLVADSKGEESGSLVFSFDSNTDWNHVQEAYNHHDYRRVITGLMYDIDTILKPEGNFNPAGWHHVQVVDEKNYVVHQCVAPSEDQYFKIGGCVFDIKKGDTPFVVVNTFKIPLDIMIDMADEAKVKCLGEPIRSKDHPMVMLEVT
jgi:uncharacterized SAM-dependent methyltransferase